MLRWFHRLMPKEERFFDLSPSIRTQSSPAPRRSAPCSRAATPSRNHQTVMDREQDADNVTREVLIAVRRTFITPFDRGNIRDLIKSMDNAIDQMQKTAKSIRLFDVTAFTPEMKDMADIILKCAELVQEAVPLLKSIGAEAGHISISPRRFRRWKARPTRCTTKACMRSFAAMPRAGTVDFFVGNEIYDHLEKVVDRFDDVANEMHGIVIEHV